MKKLTDKQARVLEFIRQRIQQDLPPTIREIAGGMGFSSTGTVRDYLNALQKKGHIEVRRNKSRAIGLKDTGFAKIPIVATIAAGKPSLAYEDIEGYLDPSDLFLGRLSHSDVFALRVRGDSMIEAGIVEGDIAVIKKQETAENGDIIAALLDTSEATLKRLKLYKNKPILEAANNNYRPIEKDFTIIGRLITIIRKYV